MCNMGYPSEVIFKPNVAKSRFPITNFLIAQPFWNFAENGSDTAVHCAKCQKKWTIETGVIDERDLAMTMAMKKCLLPSNTGLSFST